MTIFLGTMAYIAGGCAVTYLFTKWRAYNGHRHHDEFSVFVTFFGWPVLLLCQGALFVAFVGKKLLLLLVDFPQLFVYRPERKVADGGPYHYREAQGLSVRDQPIPKMHDKRLDDQIAKMLLTMNEQELIVLRLGIALARNEQIQNPLSLFERP